MWQLLPTLWQLLATFMEIFFWGLHAFSGECPRPDPGDEHPIAVSGRAEIHEIKITRQKVTARPKPKVWNDLMVDLRFPARWKSPGDSFLIRLVRLAPVLDNTGNVLSTTDALAKNPALRGQANPEQVSEFCGSYTSTLRLALEVPARRATTIRSLRGTAEVSQVKHQTLKFDLAAVRGNALHHPLLKDFVIKPTSEYEFGLTKITLRVPAVHDRLVEWGLEWGGKAPEEVCGGFATGDKWEKLSKGYWGRLPKGCSLVIKIGVPIETKTFPFDFKHIDLP